MMGPRPRPVVGWRRHRRLARPAGVVLAGCLAVTGCSDMVDPPRGFTFSLEVTAPDSTPLGDPLVVRAEVFDHAGRPVYGPPITWSFWSPDPDHPPFRADTTIRAPELDLTAIGVGRGRITAVLSGAHMENAPWAEVDVWSVAQGVRVAADSTREIVLLQGQDSVIRAAVLGSDGAPVPGGGPVQWSMSDYWNSVDRWPQGYDAIRILGSRPGTATLVGRSELCHGACADTVQIRVIQIAAAVTATPISLHALSQRARLEAMATDTRGNRIYGPAVEWSLADPADSLIVRIRGDSVEARANGSARLVARLDDVADTTEARVWQQPWRLLYDGLSVRTLTVGATDTVHLAVTDGRGYRVLRPYQATAAANTSPVVGLTVVGDTVLLRADAPGETGVVMRVEGAATSLTVRVNPALDSLFVRLSRDTLNYVGARTTAETWGVVGVDSLQVSPEYSSSDEAVATVDQYGGIRATGAGATWIRAEAGGRVDSTALTVRQVAAVVDLHPATPTVSLGGAFPLSVTVRDSSGAVIPGASFAVRSLDPGVLAPGQDGLVTAVARGQGTIEVRSGDVLAYAYAQVVPPVTDAAVSSGHFCFLTDGGGVYCAGRNDFGQLGDGSRIDHAIPVRAGQAHTFASVVAGTSFTCGITTAGETYCWGRGADGSLGTGGTGDSSVPVRVAGDPGFVQLSASDGHACGLTADGSAYCWGRNHYGQAGVGHTNPVLTPTPVAGGHAFRQIATGWTATVCALTEDGQPYCWGQLDPAPTSAPMAITAPGPLRAIAAGGCAVDQAGALLCRDGFAMETMEDGRIYRSIIDSGANFHCLLGADDLPYCFGSNYAGQLGTGDQVDRPLPTPVSGGEPARFLVSGSLSTCVGTTGGGLACWGRNNAQVLPFGSVPGPVVYP